MASTKKNTVKSTSVAKKAPIKKATTAKKVTTAKKTPATKKASANAPAKMRSFRVAPNSNFGTFKITIQTVYWVIIVSFIVFMQLWILSLQLDTSMYIESQMSALEEEL